MGRRQGQGAQTAGSSAPGVTSSAPVTGSRPSAAQVRSLPADHLMALPPRQNPDRKRQGRRRPCRRSAAAQSWSLQAEQPENASCCGAAAASAFTNRHAQSNLHLLQGAPGAAEARKLLTQYAKGARCADALQQLEALHRRSPSHMTCLALAKVRVRQAVDVALKQVGVKVKVEGATGALELGCSSGRMDLPAGADVRGPGCDAGELQGPLSQQAGAI